MLEAEISAAEEARLGLVAGRVIYQHLHLEIWFKQSPQASAASGTIPARLWKVQEDQRRMRLVWGSVSQKLEALEPFLPTLFSMLCQLKVAVF